MNAPPGFLEFLLCVPWTRLPQLSPAAGSRSPVSALMSELCLDAAERCVLVNERIQPALLSPLLEFLYRPEHVDCVPPLLRPEPGHGAPTPDLLQSAAALLDGATPLHCAALRGNPAQVQQLLLCRADPTLRTMAGLLPMQLVPQCHRLPGVGDACCSCLGPKEQQVRCWCCGATQ